MGVSAVPPPLVVPPPPKCGAWSFPPPLNEPPRADFTCSQHDIPGLSSGDENLIKPYETLGNLPSELLLGEGECVSRGAWSFPPP